MFCNHSFPSFYNEDSNILILGSFPSIKSREKEFYYMNKTNRFWRVLSRIYQDDFINDDVTIKKKLLKKYQLALYDVVESCEIVGSSDTKIKNVKPIDLKKILDNTKIDKIFCNGKKAYELYLKFFYTFTIPIFQLPSTSAAAAQYSLDDLCDKWIELVIK